MYSNRYSNPLDFGGVWQCSLTYGNGGLPAKLVTHGHPRTSLFRLGVKWSQVQILSARPEFSQVRGCSWWPQKAESGPVPTRDTHTGFRERSASKPTGQSAFDAAGSSEATGSRCASRQRAAPSVLRTTRPCASQPHGSTPAHRCRCLGHCRRPPGFWSQGSWEAGQSHPPIIKPVHPASRIVR